MPVHTRRTGWTAITALSWRGIAQRFSFALFLALSVAILVMGHSRPAVMDQFRAKAMDGLAPVFDVLSRPMVAVDGFVDRLKSYRGLVSENERLKAENEKLMRWNMNARALEAENKELRTLLNYKAEPSLSYITARVIADTGGSMVRSFVVTAGQVDGVREGMAAMSGEGLVGRVVEVGGWTSRIMLLTDVGSRIPVVLVGTSDHAILTGNNSSKLKLSYLSSEADVKVGTVVMSSGHGGVFPPNLPVGVVSKIERGEVEVAPLVSLGRINHVRLIDFNLAAGAVNPAVAKVDAAAALP